MPKLEHTFTPPDEDGNRDGEPITVELPAHWAICHTCQGDGKHSRALGSFTSDDWAELDDEWKEDYMAGRFDAICETCKGSGKVLEVDRDMCTTAEQKAALQSMDDDAEYEREARAERRMMARMAGDMSDID